MSYNYFKMHDYDRSQTVVSLLKKSMKINRERIAIFYNERQITYGELDILSDKIAQFLKKSWCRQRKSCFNSSAT